MANRPPEWPPTGEKVSSSPTPQNEPDIRNFIRTWGMTMALAAVFLVGIIAVAQLAPQSHLNPINEPSLGAAGGGQGMLSTAPGTAIIITSPSNSTTISLSTTIQGNAQGLSSGQTLWLVVVPQSVNRYYPVDAPISIQPNGTWSKLAYVGSSSDSGKLFFIVLVSASQDANSAFSDYICHGKSTGDYPGMSSLPAGATAQSAVTVIRA